MNKPFPQTPVLTDEERGEILAKVPIELFYEDEALWWKTRNCVIAEAQRDLSDRNRDEQILDWLEGELAKIPNLPDPNTECNCLNGLISNLMEALKGD